MLPDLLSAGLKLAVCGVAAGNESAAAQAYYAAARNRFWRILFEVGLTPRQLEPAEYASLLEYGIGLTDILKGQAGPDSSVRAAAGDVEAARLRIEKASPRWLCFNGKRAAKLFLEVSQIEYGEQSRQLGDHTRIFVAPSTSGAAARHWDPSLWHRLAKLVKT